MGTWFVGEPRFAERLTTAIQRFWNVPHGWVVARNLVEGDTVRTLGDLATIDAMAPGPTQPVFNLQVATYRDFFVASAGLLVHDHGQVDAVEHPFDVVFTLKNNSSSAGE